MDGKFVSYIRVSTQKQGQSGLGLEAQQESIRQYLNGGRHKVVGECVETESGKRSDNRPELQRALSLCRIHRATLLVAKLDRLARNVAFVSALMESSVDFVAIDLPQANNLTVHVMAAMAEYEAKAISERTKAALGSVKRELAEKGSRVSKAGHVYTHLGARRWDHLADLSGKAHAEGLRVRRQNRDRMIADILPMIEEKQRQGATSLRLIADALNAEGAPAPRGGMWTATQVQRVLKAAQQQKPESA